jgi:flagellar basal-body rod modification protein FlgD
MTTPIGSTSSTNTTTATGAASSTSTAPAVNTSEFLQLLVAQLKNQDPTQPAQGTDFITQLAEFSQVEQSQNQTNELTTMSTQLTGIASQQATSLVGQTVTVSGNSTNYDGTSATPASVTLGGAAADVQATISDSSGNVLRTIDMGAAPAGVVQVKWDGRSDAGTVQATGTYGVSVTATDSAGNAVPVTSSVTGSVTGVSFAAGYPAVTLSNGTTAPVSALTGVSQTPTSTSTTSP